MKKQPKLINVSLEPIIIIGEKMGKQRKGKDKCALEGNRTGDFVHEAIGDKQNIILTNIVNYYYEGKFNPGKHVVEGLEDLQELINFYEPCKIICLGTISYGYMKALKIKCPVVHLPHPSFINRFLSSQRQDYILKLRNELN